MIPFLYQKAAKIYRVSSGNTELIVDFVYWQGSALPPQFSGNMFLLGGIALRRDGCIYLGTTKHIFLYDPGQKTVTTLHAFPLDNVSGYIGELAIRYHQGKEILFFTFKKDGQVSLFKLEGDEEAVFYSALPHDDFLVPDICNPGGPEVPHPSPGYSFSFDSENEYLYIANGYDPPSGFYVYAHCGSDTLTGKPERVYLNMANSCNDLHCRDENTLYYLSRSDEQKTLIRRIDLLPHPTTDEVVYDFSQQPGFDHTLSGISLECNYKAWRLASEIRWVQRSLNILVPLPQLLLVDGSLGFKTRAAVMTFQKYWLPSEKPDGIPGARTRAKLIQVLKAHYQSPT